MVINKLSSLAITAGLLMSPITITSEVKHLCSGFLPENNMKIPVSIRQQGGINEAQFNAVLDKIDALYRPILAEKNKTLQINREWDDPTVNASAEQSNDTWIINMYGGLARHATITPDGFAVVACHEMGHHIGGAPKKRWWADWATNEGGADYFAGLRCLRDLFPDEETTKWLAENQVDPVAKTKCEELYNTQAEENLCMRSAMAGMSTALLMQALREEQQPPKFETPDPNQVSRTDDNHPGTQCRLDTYYQSGLCIHDRTIPLSDTDANVGTCSDATTSPSGIRPRCWFKP